MRHMSIWLQLNKDLICSYLKELIDVAEEGKRVVIEILSGVHEHGEEDEAIKEDKHWKEDRHDEFERKSKVFVEVIDLFLFLMSLRKLEYGK